MNGRSFVLKPTSKARRTIPSGSFHVPVSEFHCLSEKEKKNGSTSLSNFKYVTKPVINSSQGQHKNTHTGPWTRLGDQKKTTRTRPIQGSASDTHTSVSSTSCWETDGTTKGQQQGTAWHDNRKVTQSRQKLTDECQSICSGQNCWV